MEEDNIEKHLCGKHIERILRSLPMGSDIDYEDMMKIYRDDLTKPKDLYCLFVCKGNCYERK